jgi:hypothetical protein
MRIHVLEIAQAEMFSNPSQHDRWLWQTYNHGLVLF